MLKMAVVCAALLAVVGLPSSLAMVPGPPPPHPPAGGAVTVQIVPTSFRMGRRFLWRHNFDVVLTNGTRKPIRLWSHFCSRGYENLSFESRDAGGTLSKVTINGIAWTEDGPFWTEIPPGEHFVINVKFDNVLWTATPGRVPEWHHPYKLRAIYEIPPDDETAKYGVWTGRVSSDEREYELN